MQNKFHRIVYCSRNRIRGEAEEVNRELQSILASARANNSRAQVTGALLYNAGNFAQVLEGPLQSIERIFEVIQCDPRHSEVTVVQIHPITQRQFPDWSMAFAGSSADEATPAAKEAFDAVFSQKAGAEEQMMSVLQDLVVSDIDWVLTTSTM